MTREEEFIDSLDRLDKFRGMTFSIGDKFLINKEVHLLTAFGAENKTYVGMVDMKTGCYWGDGIPRSSGSTHHMSLEDLYPLFSRIERHCSFEIYRRAAR